MDTSKNDINSLIPPPPPPNPLANALNLREKDGSTQQNILSSLQSPLPDMLNLSLPEFEEQLVLSNENQEVATYEVPPDTWEPQPEMLYEDMSGLMNDMDDDDDDTSENELMYEEMTIPSPPPDSVLLQPEDADILRPLPSPLDGLSLPTSHSPTPLTPPPQPSAPVPQPRIRRSLSPTGNTDISVNDVNSSLPSSPPPPLPPRSPPPPPSPTPPPQSPSPPPPPPPPPPDSSPVGEMDVYEEIPAPNGQENPLYEELAVHQELYEDVTDSNIIRPSSSPSPPPPPAPVPVVVPVTNIPITRQLNVEPVVRIQQSGGVRMSMPVAPVPLNNSSNPRRSTGTLPNYDPPSYNDLPGRRPSVRRTSGLASSGTVPNQQQNNIQLTGYQGLSGEAPPSYDDIINTDRVRQAPIPHIPVPQFPIPQYVTPVSPLFATDFTPLNPPQNPNVDIHVVTSEIPTTLSREELGCWCCAYGQKNPTMTGLYVFLFLIGVLVPLGMLGLGLGIMLSSSETDDIPIYLIVMGSCCSFFVCWQTMALLVRVYLKAKRQPQSASWCLRVFHCGAITWLAVLGYISFLTFTSILNADFFVLFVVLLVFLGCQYVMLLYCVIECLVDIVLCFDNNNID